MSDRDLLDRTAEHAVTDLLDRYAPGAPAASEARNLVGAR